MLVFVLISLLCWTQTEGSCSAPIANIMPDNVELPVGNTFHLRCEFSCLETQQAQLWKESRNQNMLLINVSSTYPNVSLEMIIYSATEADAGNYSCKTLPPNTISPILEITIKDNVSTIEKKSIPSEGSQSCEASSQIDLNGQIWYWMLLGKTVILLLSLASLAVKYKSG